MDEIDVALAGYRGAPGHPFVDELDPFGLCDLVEPPRAEFCVELLDPVAVDSVEGPLARPVQIFVRRDRERNGRTDPPEDRIADFLLFLPAELFGRVAVRGVCGQACTLADADAASLDTDPAAEVKTSVALDNGEPRWSSGWLARGCSPARSAAGLINADRSA